jgi:hypothetical protein
VRTYIPAAFDRSIEEKIIALDRILPAKARVITPRERLAELLSLLYE